MKKITFALTVAVAALFLAGCSSLQSAGTDTFNEQDIVTSGRGVAHISGYASGFYLLWIPLITGSAEDPSTIAFFEDSCNVAAVTRMVTGRAKSLEASTVADVTSSSSSTTLPGPIPFIFSWRSVTVSGNAVK